MAILAECPRCHKKQAGKNRLCSCGEDLVKAERGQRVRYWINYRLPNGKQRREAAGYSIEEARAAEGKRKAQKIENPSILESVPAERMTFNELAAWYLHIPSVKKLVSYRRIDQALRALNGMFGQRLVSSLKPLDLEAYQQKREEEGKAPATIDLEISMVKTMVTKAFDNDLVDGRTVKAFRRVKRNFKRGSNSRRRTLSVEEYVKLCQVAPPHLQAMLALAYHTGMRLGEIRNLKWANVDRDKGFIRLSADLTKEGKAKIIPLNHYANEVLAKLPRTLAHDFVITYKGESIKSEGGCRKAHKAASEEADMAFGRNTEGGHTFHDIRRTVKTNMLAAGMDKVHRDLILGHSLQGMDTYYLSPSEDDLHRAMSIYTTWLDGQVANVDHIVDQEA